MTYDSFFTPAQPPTSLDISPESLEKIIQAAWHNFLPSGAFSALPSHSSQIMTRTDSAEIASMIDHTLLKPEATEADLQLACKEAIECGFATVCVNSSWIPAVSQALQGSSVLPIAVVGFPLGACATVTKCQETRAAITSGAREIDMVIHLGHLKSRHWKRVLEDIHAVVSEAFPYPVKVILETSSLDPELIVAGCVLSQLAGAAFVKTSTGFASGGARTEDVRLMRQVVGPTMGVKASGGIRTWADTLAMIQAGANRIGASSGVTILRQGSNPGLDVPPAHATDGY